MKIIGFCGGSSICELGTTSDAVLFFECIKYFVANNEDRGWELLTDRLCRRYLRFEELDKAIILMSHTKDIFSRTASSEVNWKWETIGDKSKSWLNPSQKSLANVFALYFENFLYCVESAKVNYEAFSSYPGYEYEPVKIVPTDLAGSATEKARPLDQYDRLDGEPFWLRK